MAIAVNSVYITGPDPARATTAWQLNATSADASGNETILATPGVGYQLVIQRAIIYIGAAISVVLNADATAMIGPVGGAAGTYILDCRTGPVLWTTNTALKVDASGAGAICVYVEGWTQAI